MKTYLLQNKRILALAAIFSSLSAAAAAFISIILQKIIDIAIAGNTQGFRQVLIFTIVYILALCVLGYISALCGKYLIRNITGQLREKAFCGIMKKTPGDFYAVNTADYLSALTNDVKMIEENYIVPLLSTIEMAVLFVITLAILFYLNPIVTAVLIASLLLMFLVPALLGKKLEKRQDRVSKQLALFTTKAKDLFSGYAVIRSFRVFKHTQKQFSSANERVIKTKFSADRLFALNEGLSDTLSSLSIVVVIFVSAYLVLIHSISMGTLLALTQLSGTFITPVILIMQNVPKIKGVKPVIDRLNAFANYTSQEFTGEKEPSFEKAINFDQVSFAYVEGKTAVEDLGFAFQKGKKYAILGQSGCGKSTLVKLLSGYYADYKGGIFYDGMELRELDIEKVSQMISMIHQDVYLFDSTIEENISMFREHSRQRWQEVLEVSGVDRFLDRVEGGLSAKVGENGANLSGGQRQRVAVARALLQKTPILILDEGTSAIDRRTAADIESKLLMQENLTLITITHSLDSALLKQYDEILFMGEGILQEKGSFDRLIKNKGGFCRFVTGKNEA